MKRISIALLAISASLLGCASVPSGPLTACRAGLALPLKNEGTEYQDPQRAVDLFTQCLDGGSSATALHAIALTLRSSAYGQLQQWNEAIADRETANVLSPPRNGRDILSLAALYRDSGNPEKALELIRKMVDDRMGLTGRGTGQGMPTYYHMGRALFELQRWPEAAEAFTVGLTYQPDYAWAIIYRGMAYQGQGNEAKAKADLERGLTLLRTTSKKDEDKDTVITSLQKPPFKAFLARYGHQPETVLTTEERP